MTEIVPKLDKEVPPSNAGSEKHELPTAKPDNAAPLSLAGSEAHEPPTAKPDNAAPPSLASSRTHEPPLAPETLLDLVQALGSYTSDNAAQREFGTALYKQYFEELPKQYGSDETARSYLREALTVTASALRGFAVERTSFKRALAREDKVEVLRGKILESKLFSSPLDGETQKKIQSLAVKLIPSGGAALLLWITDVLENHPWRMLASFLVISIWVLYGDLLLMGCMIRFQMRTYRKSGDGLQDTAEIWHESMPRYKAIAVDLLISAERLRERYYPEGTPLLPHIKWREIPAANIAQFVALPNPKLDDRKPLELLSRIVDMHFSLDRQVPSRYIPVEFPNKATDPSGASLPAQRVGVERRE